MATIGYKKIGVMGSEIDLSDLATYMATLINNDASNAQTQNDAGGVIGWIIPDPTKIHLAWNPVRVIAVQILYTTTNNPKPAGAPYGTATLSGGTTQEYYVNKNYRGDLNFMFYVNSLTNLITLQASAVGMEFNSDVSFSQGSSYAGCEFNLASFVQSVYKPITYDTGYSLAKIIYQGSDNENIWCLNGVAQQGENAELNWLTANSHHLLTRQTLIQEWGVNDGGDFNQDYNDDYLNAPQSSEPIVTLLNINENGVPSIQQKTISDIDDVQDVNTLLGENILDYMPNCKGVAVRWLNDLGGIDAWVFSLRDKRTRKAKTSGYADLYAPDPMQVKDTINVYAIDAEDTLTLGAEMLPEQVFDVLKWLPIAREVLVYMDNVSVKANRWQQVTIENYDVSESDQQGCIDFEITIRLPKLNLMV